MDRILKTERCLGYMDLKTGAIVWGHINVVYNFQIIYSCLLDRSSFSGGPITEHPDFIALASRMYRSCILLFYHSFKCLHKIESHMRRK